MSALTARRVRRRFLAVVFIALAASADARADNWFASLAQYRADIVYQAGQQMLMVLIAGLAAIVVAVPAGIWLSRPGRGRSAHLVLLALNAGQAVPKLALLALAMSLLGTGAKPAIFGLWVATLLPIAMNTYEGLRAVPPTLIDAATGIGMTKRQILWRVEMPNAMYVIFAGLRTALEFALPDDPHGSQDFRQLMDDKGRQWDRLSLPHLPADGGNEFRCIRLPFHRGAVSFTPDGAPACTKLLGDLTEPDLGSVRMFRVPNNWNHFLSDHIMHFRILPRSANRTELRTTWLVHEDAVEGVDYDVETLTSVWRATNDQDARLAANNHLGVASKAYVPGPYAPSEFMLRNFANWYADKLDAYVAYASSSRRTIALQVSNG